jgi:hypothetical protein
MPPSAGIPAVSVIGLIGTTLREVLRRIKPLDPMYGSSRISCLLGIVIVTASLSVIVRLPSNLLNFDQQNNQVLERVQTYALSGMIDATW